jgi:FAD/FMN-containing dehydrogenase
MNVDVEALAARLKREIKGEIRFDNGSRALYATDASNYRQTPIGVVIPKDNEDVIAAVQLCRQFGAPITNRGAATSLAGQCCNTAVILDFSKYMNRLLEIDPVRKIARVQPGCVCDRLRDAAEEHRLTFGPDPATHAWCTFGGMLGNNACGVHSQMAGRTSDTSRRWTFSPILENDSRPAKRPAKPISASSPPEGARETFIED